MVPAKIMMPPMVGTLRRWSFRASPGSSTKCFNLATLMSEGVATITKTKAVEKAKISCCSTGRSVEALEQD